MSKIIEFERTRKDLTPYSGLIFFQNLISRLNLTENLGKFLPRKQVNRGLSNKEKFLAGIYAFICGADCIDDLDKLRLDPFFYELTNRGLAATTMRLFIKNIPLKYFQKLQKHLIDNALSLRRKLAPDKKKIIISMDATAHEQHGQYMEGVEWDYANRWCLSSQNAFDEYGLCYGWELRNGAAHSSVGTTTMIENIFKKIPNDHRKYFRADSAYANKAIYNALLVNNVNFAICLNELAWSSLLDRYEFKLGFKKTRLRFFDSNKCQIGSCLYPLKGLVDRGFLRVVFIRTKKKKITKEDKRYYKYYAIVTNVTEKEMSDENVIRFYRKRANVENQIKDLKNGMDFKHFPCQSIVANRSWGIMGIYAYNLMRYASYILYPQTGCFLKKVRYRMVFLASEIRRGQRKIRLRFSDYVYEEVIKLWNKIHKQFCSLGLYRLPVQGQSPPW